MDGDIYCCRTVTRRLGRYIRMLVKNRSGLCSFFNNKTIFKIDFISEFTDKLEIKSFHLILTVEVNYGTDRY